MNTAVLLWALLAASTVNAANILFLVPFPGPSHWILLQHFVKELVNRGHNVTAITNDPIKNFKSPNYTEILINPSFDLTKILSMDDVFHIGEETGFMHLLRYHFMCEPSADFGLASREVQKFIHSTDSHFDLVINEEMFSESWLMFGYKFNAPMMTISTYGYSDHFDRAMGLITPYSHVPNVFLTFTDDMTYWQRVRNTFWSLYEWIIRDWIMLPAHNAIAQKYFHHLAEPGRPLPSVADLYNQISMILVIGHESTMKPRPRMPNIKYIGGAHIKPPKSLPSDFQAFLDDAKEGVIVFTLGSYVQGSAMPAEKRDIFLKAFGQLKQKVIWKFEDESLPNVPSNVLIRKWVPQSDILAHPNVVLFISHGGMSGTFEGIARGVPFLFIPLYGDQQRNALNSVNGGYARMLPFTEVTFNELAAELNELINNGQYAMRAKEVSRLFNDNLMHPMDEAMYWIEYVIRSNGAKHLKSKAADMPLVSYLLLDVFIVPIVIFSILISLVVCRLKRKPNKNVKPKRLMD